MDHRIDFPLEPRRARQALDAAFAHHAARYAHYRPRLTWVDRERASFAFEVHGLQVRGRLALEPGAVRIHVELPWALKPFRARAVRVLEEHARRELDRHRGRARVAIPPGP